MGNAANMSPFGLKRRSLIIASCALMIVFVVLYSSPHFDTDRIKSMMPTPHMPGSDKPATDLPVSPPDTGSSSNEELAEDPTDEPTDKSSDKSSDKAADKPAEKPAEKPDEKPDEKPADEPTEELAEEPAEEPAEEKKPDEKPAEKPAEEKKPAEEPAKEPTEELAENPEDKTEDKPADEANKKPSGQPDPNDTLTDDSNTAPHFGSLDPNDKSKISRLHHLIPASGTQLDFCINLVSSIAMRYVPIILGWKAEGVFDAAKSHLAKMHTINRYLDTLGPDEDDDLVIIVDGYDIIMQMPAEVMIERYYETAWKADERVAKRFGISVEETRARGLRQTIFWGPDKICWPNDGREARCWAVPVSGLGANAFGPKSGNGEMYYSDPRWLNSGTVIGPVNDLRRYIKATLREIKETYNPEFVNKESDQYYLANIWGRQEYFRSLKAANGKEVEGGPGDRHNPKKTEGEDPEFHISIDYESGLFQTKAGYEPFFGYLQYNQSNLRALQTRDMFEQGPEYKPYHIQMPPNVVSGLTRLYDDIPDEHPGSRGSDWIRTVELATNFVTHHIFAVWHCTGPKQWIKAEYHKMWFYPYAEALMKAAVRASQVEELLTEAHIDGRRWKNKIPYPPPDKVTDERGGAWTDKDGLTFSTWHELCPERYDGFLFRDDPWTQ